MLGLETAAVECLRTARAFPKIIRRLRISVLPPAEFLCQSTEIDFQRLDRTLRLR